MQHAWNPLVSPCKQGGERIGIHQGGNIRRCTCECEEAMFTNLELLLEFIIYTLEELLWLSGYDY